MSSAMSPRATLLLRANSARLKGRSGPPSGSRLDGLVRVDRREPLRPQHQPESREPHLRLGVGRMAVSDSRLEGFAKRIARVEGHPRTRNDSLPAQHGELLAPRRGIGIQESIAAAQTTQSFRGDWRLRSLSDRRRYCPRRAGGRLEDRVVGNRFSASRSSSSTGSDLGEVAHGAAGRLDSFTSGTRRPQSCTKRGRCRPHGTLGRDARPALTAPQASATLAGMPEWDPGLPSARRPWQGRDPVGARGRRRLRPEEIRVRRTRNLREATR